MSSFKRISLIVTVELCIIAIIGIHILYKQHTRTISVMPIHTDEVVFPRDSQLRYFYELPTSTTLYPGNEWISKGTANTINSDGLNERYEYEITKPEDTYRIITLGDSNTYGVYVPTAQNYPEKLEDLLNNTNPCKSYKKIEVINLGVYGYDLQYEIEHFKRKGQKYNADLVIWMIKNSDFYINNELISPIRDELTKKDTIITQEGTAEDNHRAAEIKAVAVDKSIELIGKEKLEKAIKEEMSTINKYFSNKLLLLTFSRLDTTYQATVKEFISKRPSTFWYSSPTGIYENKSLTFLPADSHANRKGYSVISKEVFSYLTANNIIDCRK